MSEDETSQSSYPTPVHFCQALRDKIKLKHSRKICGARRNLLPLFCEVAVKTKYCLL